MKTKEEARREQKKARLQAIIERNRQIKIKQAQERKQKLAEERQKRYLEKQEKIKQAKLEAAKPVYQVKKKQESNVEP